MTDTNLDKPIALLTVRELLEVIEAAKENDDTHEIGQVCEAVNIGNDGKRYVYGIEGLARLLGCSKATANRIKKSGKIDGAITQIGRKIIIDADKSLELANIKTGGRGSRR